MAELETDDAIAALLREVRTIAVLGAHSQHVRPAFYVPDYLRSQGYRILPVNLALAGERLWGEPVLPSLSAIDEPVDLVDVFRRAELLPGHLDDLLSMRHRPRAVWLQQGIRNDDFARAVQAAGMDVVQDRCTLADHRRLGIGRVLGAGA